MNRKDLVSYPPLTVLFLAVLLLAATAVLADSSSRPPGGTPPSQVPASARTFALVVDPEGAPSAPSETLHYLLTRKSQELGVIYAFSTPEARARFVARHIEGRSEDRLTTKTTCPDAQFNNAVGCSPTDWLIMACGQTNAFLSDHWNDRLSCVYASGSWTILYKCYNFNRPPYNPDGTCSTLALEGGTVVTDLNVYNFNNITSSIKVCPQGITFSDCLNFF